MSKYNRHAEALTEAIKAAQAELDQAQQAAQQAAEKAAKFQNSRNTDEIFLLKKKCAEREAQQAKDDLARAKRDFSAKLKKNVEVIRQALVDEVQIDHMADPAQIDNNALELLRSGIMNGAEYEKMLERFQGERNATMCRLLADHASAAERARTEKYGENDAEAISLRNVARSGAQFDGREVLNAFDDLSECVNRCADNPSMIGQLDNIGFTEACSEF